MSRLQTTKTTALPVTWSATLMTLGVCCIFYALAGLYANKLGLDWFSTAMAVLTGICIAYAISSREIAAVAHGFFKLQQTKAWITGLILCHLLGSLVAVIAATYFSK